MKYYWYISYSADSKIWVCIIGHQTSVELEYSYASNVQDNSFTMHTILFYVHFIEQGYLLLLIT